MYSGNRVWLVPENEQENVHFENAVREIKDQTPVMIEYRSLQRLMKMDFLVFGRDYLDVRGISGVVMFHGRMLKDSDFKIEVTIMNKYFRELFEYMKRDIKLKGTTLISFLFEKDLPVVVKVENKRGAIAPYVGKDMR